MRTVVPDFDFLRPSSVDDALQMKKEKPQRRFFAGGTDLMVEAEAGLLKAAEFIDIHYLRELRNLTVEGEQVRIGALATYTDLMKHKTIQEHFPLLVRAAEETAAPAIQNRGTIGGNVANASPAADTPPAMLVYDCHVVLQSSDGEREVAYESFHHDYKKMDMKADEIIKEFVFKIPSQASHETYIKVGTRKMQAISKVVFAARGDNHQGSFKNVRLAFGSVAPIPLRCKNTENLVNNMSFSELKKDDVENVVKQDVSPIDDIRSTATYRFDVTTNLIWRFLSDLSGK